MKVKVAKIAAKADEALSPASAVWGRVPGTRVVLEPSPLENQPSAYVRALPPRHGKIHEIEVRALHNGESLFFHLAWTDPNQDTTPTDAHPFPDAAAVMMPLPEAAEMVFEGDAISMGADNIPVNAWLWRPDFGEQAKNVTARGFGTSKRSADGGISARSEYARGRWAVVFGRALKPQLGPEESAPVTAPGKTLVAFAVWEGANNERAGLKAVSPKWITLEVAS
ncbi:MAG: hypothetical protein HYY13_08665 [Nitrospirae bacterium]|nr:hypothetical protein [Nitrospirota bacterium]